MAKINISFDTIEKTLKVTKDGVQIDNIKSASFYPSYENEDQMKCHLCMMEEDEDEGTKMYHDLIASAQKDGFEVEFGSSKAVKDAVSFLKRD